MFVVTGATGRLGRQIVHKLLDLVPVDRIGVSVRDAEKACDLANLGVRVRQADFGDPCALRYAFEGAERILLISSNAAATGGDTLGQHRAAISAAKEAGVARLLYTSQMSASATSRFPPGRAHAATEAMLAESGLAWTALRHGFYASSVLMMNGAALADGLVAAPEDGKVAWTDHEDLAEADAILLAGIEEIDGPTPPLTADEALDLSDLGALAADILGKSVQRTVLTDEAMRSRMRDHGVPDETAAIAMGYYLAARSGEFAALDPTLERLLGRRPKTMQTLLAQALPTMI